jgi:hypothetical protein
VSEQIPGTSENPANPDRYKTLVMVLTILTTVITAIVAGIQADANIRASINNRDSQVEAILVSGELHRQGLQAAYDTDVFSAYLKDSQEATVLQLTALQQEQAGDEQASQATQQRAETAQARADTAQKFSVFFTDPRYAAKSAGEMPDMQAYLADITAPANELLAKQNLAADAYGKWNRKGDAYTSVLAVAAVAFLLFGLAQALSQRLRLLFAIFGSAAVIGAVIWTLIIMVG